MQFHYIFSIIKQQSKILNTKQQQFLTFKANICYPLRTLQKRELGGGKQTSTRVGQAPKLTLFAKWRATRVARSGHCPCYSYRRYAFFSLSPTSSWILLMQEFRNSNMEQILKSEKNHCWHTLNSFLYYKNRPRFKHPRPLSSALVFLESYLSLF